MKTNFTTEEVKAINRRCLLCEHHGSAHYCLLYKTDSIVFRFDKCARLNHALDLENTEFDYGHNISHTEDGTFQD